MMDPGERNRLCSILEIPPEAGFREVQNAYLRLKKLYSGSSIALAPLEEEFPRKRRDAILREIEEAYERIRADHVGRPSKMAALFPEGDEAKDGPGEASEAARLEEIAFSGPVLRNIRERLGVDAGAMAKELKLRPEFLRGLEEDRFEMLPQTAYLRGHLVNYARFLGLRPERVVEDYLRRAQAWKDAGGGSSS